MKRLLPSIFALIAGLHGLIHLAGFAAYWPFASLSDLPYKTTLLGGQLELGAAGMRVFSLLWLLAALIWLASMTQLIRRRPAYALLMLAGALLSLGLCLLDWEAAWRGAWVNLVFLLVLFFIFGLRQKPAPFPPYSGAPAYPQETIPLPPGLPVPVERFYRRLYPDGYVPVIRTAILSGRGSLRLAGITFPARVRFTHLAGQAYRHYLEPTFFGFPVFKVNEHFLDGRARLELPVGVVENDPAIDSAANLGLWAEMCVYPASYLTDGRTRWEGIDEHTARLIVPWQEGEQTFTCFFDPDSGALLQMETIRYRDSKTPPMKWTVETILQPANRGLPGHELRTATWEDEGTPWLIMEYEEEVFNVDIGEYIQQRGP